MTFRFEEPNPLDYGVVAKARIALAAAEVAGRKAQNALDKARLKFDRAAGHLRAEGQAIEYDFNDTLA